MDENKFEKFRESEEFEKLLERLKEKFMGSQLEEIKDQIKKEVDNAYEEFNLKNSLKQFRFQTKKLSPSPPRGTKVRTRHRCGNFNAAIKTFRMNPN